MSSVYGGHAVMSQGGVSIIDTPVQAAAGQKDSPDLAYRDFIEWGEGANREWVRYYVDHSRRQIHDWLVDLGVQFSGVLDSPGNSVARFHQPVGRGIGLVTPVYRACLERPNVRFVWNTRADSLVVRDLRVVGVRTTGMRGGAGGLLEADAVVLATGGFQSNLDLVREGAGDRLGSLEPSFGEAGHSSGVDPGQHGIGANLSGLGHGEAFEEDIDAIIEDHHREGVLRSQLLRDSAGGLPGRGQRLALHGTRAVDHQGEVHGGPLPLRPAVRLRSVHAHFEVADRVPFWVDERTVKTDSCMFHGMFSMFLPGAEVPTGFKSRGR
jgi:choline dehydrogenase-like flavoprotein